MGGLVGFMEIGQITDSYATGSVSGSSYIGGLIGGVDITSNTSNTTLTRVYAAGKVKATYDVFSAGLTGAHFDNIKLTAAYYDKDGTGKSDRGTYSGTPLSHEDMGKEESFKGWNFETTWHLDDRDGLPTFLSYDDKPPIMSGAEVPSDTLDQVSVYFPENLIADSEALARFTVSVDGSDVEIRNVQLRSNGKELTLTLEEPVLIGQKVKVTYAHGEPAITDKAQNPLQSSTIQADNGELIRIVTYAPADDATGVPADTKLTLTFNDTVEAVAGKYIYLMTAGGDIAEMIGANSSYVEVSGQQVTISFPANMLPLKGYYVLMDSGAFQHEGEEVSGISDPTAWNFVTAPELGAEWVSIGEGFSEGKATYPVLKAGTDGTLYVLFRDDEHDRKATVMKLGANDSAWSLVGSAGFSQGEIGAPSLLVEDHALYAAYGVDQSVYVMKYELNGDGDWTQVGSSLAADDISVSDPYLLMNDGTVYVAYRDQSELGIPSANKVELAESAAADGTFTLVVLPVEFTIRATYGDKTIEVSKFDVYVERTIAIPDGVDPSKITTGVVVDADGTVRHVPTKIIVVDGQYYAVVSSLTNSIYTVIWNPVEFSDVASHWAKDTVNNMGSRMIIQGTGEGNFNPDRDITRAEFAAIIVRALGLKLEQGSGVFTDVSESDWFNSAVHTAYAYGLLNGYTDGTFRPNEKITCEQAMAIISRAMVITGLKAKLPVQSEEAALVAFADAAQIRVGGQRHR